MRRRISRHTTIAVESGQAFEVELVAQALALDPRLEVRSSPDHGWAGLVVDSMSVGPCLTRGEGPPPWGLKAKELCGPLLRVMPGETVWLELQWRGQYQGERCSLSFALLGDEEKGECP